MAFGALFGGRLIKPYLLSPHSPHELVAVIARHVLMHTLQGKRSFLFVVEYGGLPPGAVVATCARSNVVLCKLLAVDILVTLFTLGRRRGEVRFAQLGLKIGGFVAVNARRRPVCAIQRERGLVVVKDCQIIPGFCGVAGRTPRRFPVFARLAHPLVELAVVRIFVATGANQILPMVLRGRFWLEGVCLLVAIGARDRDMAAGQCKLRFPVPRQSERGGMVAVHGVTRFAVVLVGRTGKLAGVLIGVTVGAVLEFDLV